MKLGYLLVILAIGGVLFSGWNYFQLTRDERRNRNLSYARNGFYFMTLMVVLSSIYLLYLILTHRFQVSYVYRYSSTDLPLGYLISAFWAGQEGSFLLWAFLIAVMGLVFIRQAREYEAHGMLFLNIIQAFFLILLLKASPFTLSPQTPTEGAGLNPLLQNFWMVIHPPILFIGYAGIAFPMVIAWAALQKRQYVQWASKVFPWVVFSSLTLGAGIIIGGFWAYEVLGWGGYWGWDPVENSSLVPWLTILALIHGLVIQKIKGALQKTNIFLAIISFVLVLYATYLTRSGVLSDFSVHSFTDFGINIYMILFILITLVIGLSSFFSRYREIPKVPVDMSTLNRENSLVGSMWLFGISAFFIFIGTSSPIFTGFVGDPSQVHISFYNMVNLPIGIFMALLLGVTPFLHWRGNEWRELLIQLIPSILVSIVTALIAIFFGLTGSLKILFAASAVFALTSNVINVFRSLRISWQLIGAPLSHVGFGIMLVGIIVSASFSQNDRVVLTKEVPVEIFNYRMVYQGITPMHNGKDIINIEVSSAKSNYTAKPRFYYSQYNQSMMREPDVNSNLLYDLYLSPLEKRQLSDNSGGLNSLVIKKGERKMLGDYEIHFANFEMSDHSQGNPMRIGVKLEISNGKEEYTVVPVIFYDANGKHSEPVPINTNTEDNYQEASVTLNQLNASEKSIELHFSGLKPETKTGSQSQEQLLLEVSKKPFMNILWFGTILIVLGAIISMKRRITELS
jgi:cytochrome c-type biogenesis protein CcmF